METKNVPHFNCIITKLFLTFGILIYAVGVLIPTGLSLPGADMQFGLVYGVSVTILGGVTQSLPNFLVVLSQPVFLAKENNDKINDQFEIGEFSSLTN